MNGHRIITTGPTNARDWRVICTCGARINGRSVKDVKAQWADHAKSPTDGQKEN